MPNRLLACVSQYRRARPSFNVAQRAKNRYKMFNAHRERNQEATAYVGNLDDRVTEALVWELFTQAGPVGT